MSAIPPAASDFMESADSHSASLPNVSIVDTHYNNMNHSSLALKQCQWDMVVTLSNLKFQELPEVDEKYLKRLRLKHGLSQQAFADRLGVALTTVSRWERVAGDVEAEKEPEAIASEPLTFSDLMKRQKLSVNGLAEKMEISRQTVGNWISRRALPSLSPAQTLKLLQLLDCSLEELAQSLSQNILPPKA